MAMTAIENVKKTPNANITQLAKFKAFLTSIFMRVHYMHGTVSQTVHTVSKTEALQLA